jgi:hypothetical protein
MRFALSIWIVCRGAAARQSSADRLCCAKEHPFTYYSGSSRRGIPEGAYDLGYIEGKNMRLEYRYAVGMEDLPGLVAELVQLIPPG